MYRAFGPDGVTSAGHGDKFSHPMKAIETKYNGRTFRSRLEARWAIFMDALGVQWEYEPEAYELDGICYLPDFWLPDQRVFLEAKPDDPTPLEYEKARRLATFRQCSVIIVVGAPRRQDFGQSSPICVFPNDGGDDHPYFWCECPTCHRIDIQFDGRSGRIRCACDVPEKCYTHDVQRIVRATERAQLHTFWVPGGAR